MTYGKNHHFNPNADSGLKSQLELEKEYESGYWSVSKNQGADYSGNETAYKLSSTGNLQNLLDDYPAAKKIREEMKNRRDATNKQADRLDNIAEDTVELQNAGLQEDTEDRYELQKEFKQAILAQQAQQAQQAAFDQELSEQQARKAYEEALEEEEELEEEEAHCKQASPSRKGG
ncbi:MAG: hypothetical protein QM752_01080 [Gammaproteobacteria bacterium]